MENDNVLQFYIYFFCLYGVIFFSIRNEWQKLKTSLPSLQTNTHVELFKGAIKNRKRKAALPIKGQVVQKVGQRSRWASGALMLSTLAHTHTHVGTHTHTFPEGSRGILGPGRHMMNLSVLLHKQNTVTKCCVFFMRGCSNTQPRKSRDTHIYWSTKLMAVKVKELNQNYTWGDKNNRKTVTENLTGP